MFSGVKKLTVISASLLIAASAVQALSVEEILPEKTVVELRQKGHLENTRYKSETIELVYKPQTPLTEIVSNIWPKNKAVPVYYSEQIYLMKKTALGSGDPSKNNIEYASKILRSPGKMQGMQYYSNRDKKVTTLYKECYSIKGPKNREKIADDTEGSADGKIFYCLQNDHSFGKTEYRMEYHQTADEVNVNFINVSPLYVGNIIKGVDTEDLRISFVMTDCGEELVVYMLVQAKFPGMKMLEDSMNDSFSSRLNAIYKWFIEQFD